MNIFIDNKDIIDTYTKFDKTCKIYKINEFIKFKDVLPIMVIGHFDSIHMGHLNIIKEAIKKAREDNTELVMYTMINHTKKIDNPITTIAEKLTFFKNLGFNHIILEDFKNIINIEAIDFINDVLVKKFKISHLFCGFNFGFGKNRGGNVNLLRHELKKYGVNVTVSLPFVFKMDNKQFKFKTTDKLLEAEENGYSILSTSYIKKTLKVNDIETTNKLLAKPYVIIGKVIHGKQLGRTIGFPTANLKYEKKVYPRFGVYGVRVRIEDYDKSFYGVMNIGNNPTISNDYISIETNIFDFNEDIYGKIIYIEVLKFIRGEVKFANFSELKEQINNDVNTFKKIINNGEINEYI